MALAAYLAPGGAATGLQGTLLLEGFEETTFPNQPDGVVAGTARYTRSCYSSTGGSGVAQIRTDAVNTGTRSYLVDETGGSSHSFVCRFTLTNGQNMCNVAAGGFAFAMKFSTSGGAWTVGIAESSTWTAGASLPAFHLSVSANNGQSTGLSMRVHSSAAGGATQTSSSFPPGITYTGSMTPGTTTFGQYGFACGGGEGTWIDYSSSSTRTVTANPSDNPTGFVADTFYVWSGPGFSSGGPPIYIDDLNFGVQGAPGPAAATRFDPKPYFCSLRGAERFGYNYKEGVVYDSSTVDDEGLAEGQGINQAYEFVGSSDNFDYLGKAIGGTTYGAKTFFQIESSNDGASSVFRVAYSFVDWTSYSIGAGTANHRFNGPDDPGPDYKGDGLDEGAFAEYVEARFKEVDSDWDVAIYHVSQLNGVVDRTKIGQSRLADNPNTPHAYVLTVDTRAGKLYASIRHADGTQIGGGTVDALNQSLPAFFTNKPVYSQWFVGHGTSAVFQAKTWLDNEDVDNGSTCIYLLRDFVGDNPTSSNPCVGECGAGGPRIVYDNETGQASPEPTNAPGGGNGGAGPSSPRTRNSFLEALGPTIRFVVGIIIIFLFGFVTSRWISDDPESIKGAALLGWVTNVFLFIWPLESLIAACALGVAVFAGTITQAVRGVWSKAK